MSYFYNFILKKKNRRLKRILTSARKTYFLFYINLYLVPIITLFKSLVSPTTLHKTLLLFNFVFLLNAKARHVSF